MGKAMYVPYPHTFGTIIIFNILGIQRLIFIYLENMMIFGYPKFINIPLLYFIFIYLFLTLTSHHIIILLITYLFFSFFSYLIESVYTLEIPKYIFPFKKRIKVKKDLKKTKKSEARDVKGKRKSKGRE